MAIVALAALLLWGWLAGAAWLRDARAAGGGRTGEDAGRGGKGKMEPLDVLLVRPFLPLWEGGRGIAFMPTLTALVHAKLQLVRGERAGPAEARRFLALATGTGYAAFAALACLAALEGEIALLAAGVLVAPLIPAARVQSLFRKAEERRRAIVMALPELLGRLMMLVGAGDTVPAALARCADSGPKDHPLYAELGRSLQAVRNGESFQQALDGFGKRCGVQEASIFAAVLTLNLRKGGDSFALALRELSYTMWEKRKTIARIKGEEAASKLAFPLAVIFLVLMVLVGAPAMMLMS